jgi:vancomycin permeability regulator SanA
MHYHTFGVAQLCIITQNLHIALQYLRQKDKPRLFWIDAICINQTDLEERSAQVLKMKDIFEKANDVVIWLGVGSDETALAMSFIRKVWRF